MPTNQPGVNIFAGAPLLADDLYATTGEVFYVGSVAVPGGVAGVDDRALGRHPKQPYATIDFAIGSTTAGRGDLIIVLPGHAETVTAAITCDIAGVRIVGLGWGRLRPAITPSGAIDAMNVTAANVHIHNLRFVSAAADVTAHINVAAADFRATLCVFEQAQTPLYSITVPRAGDRFHFDQCTWMGVTSCAADGAIQFEGAGGTGIQESWRVTNCIFDYGTNGVDDGVIQSSFETTGGLVWNCTMIGVDTLIYDFNSSISAQGDGLIANVLVVAGAGIADIDTARDAGGYSSANVLITDSAAESASKTPLTTPA